MLTKYEGFAEMRPLVELPRNLGFSVTPYRHKNVYILIRMLSGRGLHV